MRKKLYRVLITVLVVLLSIIVVINLPIIQVNHKDSDNDYSNWMRDSLSNDKFVTDVKMLGAHDAFSQEINYFSDVDTSADSILKGFVGKLIKGFIVKQSVTQIASPNELLKNGVRYFDVRLTYDNDTWVTKHNYVSGEFEPIADEIISFLTANKGEFLVLDFQHISGVDYSSDEDYLNFYNMLDEYGLLEYIYQVSSNNLDNLTYGELTNNGLESKLIIIDKFTKVDKNTMLYSSSIRSNWANSDSFDDVYSFLEDEKVSVENSDYSNFVVMQAVTTMNMSPSGFSDAIMNWSLIERAEKFNSFLIQQDNFLELTETLPIIMVDYCNSAPFIDDIMELIMENN